MAVSVREIRQLGQRNGTLTSGCHNPDIASFFALASGGDGELHRQSLSKALALIAFDLRMVDEEIIPAVPGQEPVAPSSIEELHSPRHGGRATLVLLLLGVAPGRGL